MNPTKRPELKSWKNVEAAFAGESMAYQKYKYFAKIARKNGDEEFAKLFDETASHETSHAEGHLRHLYPFDSMTTQDCLRVAMEGERFEYTEMYPGYAKTAADEAAEPWMQEEFAQGIEECKDHAEMFARNLEKAQAMFNGLAKVEQEHHDNYKAALEKQGSKPSFSASEAYLKEKE